MFGVWSVCPIFFPLALYFSRALFFQFVLLWNVRVGHRIYSYIFTIDCRLIEIHDMNKSKIGIVTHRTIATGMKIFTIEFSFVNNMDCVSAVNIIHNTMRHERIGKLRWMWKFHGGRSIDGTKVPNWMQTLCKYKHTHEHALRIW